METIPPFLKDEYSGQQSCDNKEFCNFAKSVYLKILKPVSYQPNTNKSVINNTLTKNASIRFKSFDDKTIDKIEPTDETKFNYPFETEEDLKKYLQYGNAVEEIYNEVINGDDEVLEDMYLNVVQPDGTKKYNDSLKIFKNGPVLNKGSTGKDDKRDSRTRENDSERKKFLCKKQFSDEMTTFVNSTKILNDSSEKIKNIARYQYLLNTFFTKIRDIYINENGLRETDIIFMYKGGTTMKILYKEYEKYITRFPQFMNEIKLFFSRSDSDYTYLINPALENFEKIYYHFSKITVLGLCVIKNIFIENEEFFLDMNEINESDMINTINKFNDKIENIRRAYNDVLLDPTDLAKSLKLKETTDVMHCETIIKIDKIIGFSFVNNLDASREIKMGGGNRSYFIEEIPDDFKIVSFSSLEDNDDKLPKKTKKFRKTTGPSTGSFGYSRKTTGSSTGPTGYSRKTTSPSTGSFGHSRKTTGSPHYFEEPVDYPPKPELSKIEQFRKYKMINSGRSDFYLTKSDIKNDKESFKGNIDCYASHLNDKNNFYVSTNETVYFESTEGSVMAFMLSRIKYNFVVYFRSEGKYGYFNVPSEIVDVSMSKKVAYDLGKTYAGLEKKISVYGYIYNDADKKNRLEIKYNGLSLAGFINDFLKILFYEFYVPWKADKYKKRLYRLLFFVYIELLVKKKTEILGKIVNYFKTMNETIYSELASELKDTGTLEFLSLYEERISKNVRDKIIYEETGQEYGDVNYFREMKDVILVPTFEEFRDKNHSEEEIELPPVESGVIPIHHLGGFSKKYEKYNLKIKNLLSFLN